MSDSYYYLGYTEETINSQKFLCFYILNLDKKLVFRIFKKFTDDSYNRAISLEVFEEITSYITFTIKRDGKISLDIKI